MWDCTPSAAVLKFHAPLGDCSVYLHVTNTAHYQDNVSRVAAAARHSPGFSFGPHTVTAVLPFTGQSCGTVFQPISICWTFHCQCSRNHWKCSCSRITVIVQWLTCALQMSLIRISIRCSASMLSFCMTVCRLQTAQTDDRTQLCIYFSRKQVTRVQPFNGSDSCRRRQTDRQTWA